MHQAEDVTRLLRAWSDGDAAAGDVLLRQIYAEIGRIARVQARRSPATVTLQTAELVHEAWLRLHGQNTTDWQNRAHFFALAATMVRRVLVDHARRRHAQRRDRDCEVPLEQAPFALSTEQSDEVLALHQGLEQLAELNPRQAALVELRYFGGLSLDEVAQVQQTSLGTAKRDWALAKAWLYRRLGGSQPGLPDQPAS